MNYKVHKNILDDELYGIIHDLFNGNQFPWYYQKSTLHESHYYDDNEFMFAHKFYQQADEYGSKNIANILKAKLQGVGFENAAKEIFLI